MIDIDLTSESGAWDEVR